MFWACAIGRGSVGLPIGHAVRGFCGYVFSCGLLFPHPMPLGIGYFLYGFVDVFGRRV